MSFSKKRSIILSRNNPIILDELDRFIFFPNNKVCQTSVARVALKDRAVIFKDDNNKWQEKTKQITSDYFSSIFSFSIVRNPYDRAVSSFIYLQSEGMIDPEFCFTGFCFDILQHEGTSYDPHFDLQSDGLFYERELIPNFVARFEHIGRDWRKITRKIDGPKMLPHANKSHRGRHYFEYYDKFSRYLISELYADDIKNFQYKFLSKKFLIFMSKYLN